MSTSEPVQILRMGGKPVFNVPAKSVVNFKSGFGHKLLCDGLTFSAGSACQYSCTFCYVDDLMRKSPHLANVREQFKAHFPDLPTPAHSEIIIRREGVLNALRSQLAPRNTPKFLYLKDHPDQPDTRVIYMSPLVDVAASLLLCEETVEACKIILELTNWQIRMLSKSSLLPLIARALGTFRDAHKRVIYGVSTGTLDNKLARTFEQGTALVSKRIESLRWLQDNGYRTYGMICPSLPYETEAKYKEFSKTMCEAIRVDRCEHVWAEVMNIRGESFTRTVAALQAAGYVMQAEMLDVVQHDKAAWEEYSRATFEAHTEFIDGSKLRFLQYVTNTSRSYWESQVQKGAVNL